jgi:hypothetical protein
MKTRLFSALLPAALIVLFAPHPGFDAGAPWPQPPAVVEA